MIENHHIRRIWQVVLLIVMMGSTSCSTIKQPTRRGVILPNKVVTKEGVSITQEEIDLAKQLSTSLRVNIDLAEDNLLLYAFTDDWLGTKYRFGGTGKGGTDCSGFVYRLYQEVYKTNVGRQSSADLMSKTKRVNKGDLQEGDMVFFNINNRRGGRASHVGVYLKNDKFVHASTQRGVIISDLNDPYYKKTYLGAGRVN